MITDKKIISINAQMFFLLFPLGAGIIWFCSLVNIRKFNKKKAMIYECIVLLIASLMILPFLLIALILSIDYKTLVIFIVLIFYLIAIVSLVIEKKILDNLILEETKKNIKSKDDLILERLIQIEEEKITKKK